MDKWLVFVVVAFIFSLIHEFVRSVFKIEIEGPLAGRMVLITIQLTLGAIMQVILYD